jgi:hypothetical protein
MGPNFWYRQSNIETTLIFYLGCAIYRYSIDMDWRDNVHFFFFFNSVSYKFYFLKDMNMYLLSYILKKHVKNKCY